MKLLILIPSKARATRLEAMTGSWLFESGIDFVVLVEPQDYEAYKKILALNISNLLQLPEDNKGLNYSLHHGKEYAEQNGYDVIFKIDDDIAGWHPTYDKKDLYNYGKKDERQRNDTERFQVIMKEIAKPLEHSEIGGISFGYRFEFWHNKKWQAFNWRFQTCYAVKTELFNPDPTVGYMGSMWQDFVDFLNVIVADKKVLRYGRYTMDTDVETGEGGFQEMYKNRTPEIYKQIIERLRAKFPLLKWRMKKNGMIEPDFSSPFIRGKEL